MSIAILTVFAYVFLTTRNQLKADTNTQMVLYLLAAFAALWSFQFFSAQCIQTNSHLAKC